MKRALATSLVLVNWRGVFYERYEFDRHVTALEGDNGAGKTTVMIAAYIVLLPDMSRLSFTNLGATGATGADRGIWGRLGELGRPSYALLEFFLPSSSGAGGRERICAGVLLDRKSEPTVEPTPFLITDLGEDVRLQSVMLLTRGELDAVPELSELKENVARLGGRLQTFPSARAYFRKLFSLGITPMRLGTDEERNKLNEMLRTSMTGGMSRGLLSELRDFLLKKESGLTDVLKRMRANLDACRRTRVEVTEARELEQEIGGIFEVGEEMFATAVAATRQRAEEVERRLQSAQEQLLTSQERAQQAQIELQETEQDLLTLQSRRQDAAGQLERARRYTQQLEEALGWAAQLRERAEVLAGAERAFAQAEQRRAQAQQSYEASRRELDRASHQREMLAAGLADLQRGLEELHRQLALYRRVRSSLGRAEEHLQIPSGARPALEAAREDALQQRAALDAERRQLSRTLDDAQAHLADFELATEAVGAILGPEALEEDTESPHDRGLRALRKLRGWREAIQQRPIRAEQLREVQQEMQRQQRAREIASELGLEWEQGQGRAVVEQTLVSLDEEIAALKEDELQARADQQQAWRLQEELLLRIERLQQQSATYRGLTRRAARISEALQLALFTREALDRARETIQQRRNEAGQRAEELRGRREELLHQARALRQGGASLPDALLSLRDALGAELLAARFDALPIEEAAVMEARLGPLHAALIVPDLDEASRAVAERPESLSTVYLVAEDARLSLEELPSNAQRDVQVELSQGRRITRLPGRPMLGQAARERAAEELEEQAEKLLPAIEELRASHRALSSLALDADALLADLATWLQADPEPILASTGREREAARANAELARASMLELQARAAALRPRRRALRQLLPDAALLDAVERRAREAALRAGIRTAEHGQQRLEELDDAPATLERRLHVLRHPPLSSSQLEQRRQHLAALDRQRDRLSEGLEALEVVLEHHHALAWGDREQLLSSRQQLVPALQAQLEEALAQLEAAREKEQQDRAQLDARATQFHQADARRSSAQERHREAQQRLEQTEILEPTEAMLQSARQREEELGEQLRQVEQRDAQAQRELGRRQTGLQVAQEAAEGAAVKLEDEQKQARPALESWATLEPKLERAQLLEGTQLDSFRQRFAGRGSVNLFPEARSRRDMLFELLGMARGQGARVREEARAALEAQEGTQGEGYLLVWTMVLDWLRARLPARIVEGDDPREALARLRDQLEGLGERLERQERELRIASAEIANNIQSKIKKARGRVMRLNTNLDGLRFGSIEGIRVTMGRVERMERVLDSLREESAQDLLFGEAMELEEALDELFRRFGGKGSGGQRLLDYREYIQLQVEVRRHREQPSWEIASPTRLSTGEAIGVGASLMMVVLTEWERDANLLRGRRSFGSMRFLFLDEANRLDSSNLRTVFDLCQTLDLQLMVAAPAVAQSQGCTVYRLVRSRDASGRERVLVSGRRVIAPGQAAP